MTVNGVFGWSPETWTAVGTLALATATALAVLAGPASRWRDRARLRMEIRKRPPDTHMIEMRDVRSGAFVCNALYARVRVSHRHGKAAENAEMLAARLWRMTDPGARQPVSAFLPLSLNWSHVGGPTIRVPRRLFRHCDLGHFQMVGEQTMFILDTIVQPNPVQGGEVPNVLPPGRYEIELRLSGDNAKTLSRRWRIEFGPDWSDNEATMLERVQIEATSTRFRARRRHAAEGAALERVNQDRPTAQQVADRILELVRETVPGAGGVETKDRNERLLVAAYGRAYRCFTSIRELTSRNEADDALVLARTLLSIVLKSIYLVAPDDSAERELRFRRASLTYAEQRKKLAEEMRAAGFETEAPERLQDLADRLRQDSVTPLPDEKSIADALDLGHFYTRIYRMGSDVTHYSIGSMLDGFLEGTLGEGATGEVSLEMPDPPKADEVLMMAALTYGVFLHLSEKIISHGLGQPVRDLLLEYHA